MTDYLEDTDFELEYEEMFNNWYEIDGAKKIKELSRQLRTFFNFKAEVIRSRFGPTSNLTERGINLTTFTQKQEFESLACDFIILLKKIKKNGLSLKQGIQSLFFENSKSSISKLSEMTEKISMLLHYFSEVSIHDHPRFFKFIVILAQSIFLVKKYLNAQFSEFYGELEINYHSLERELEILLENTSSVKIKVPKKQYEERLTS